MNIFKKAKKGIASLGLMLALMAFAAVPAFAATPNADLTTVTSALTDGAGDMKTNAMTLITVVIGILVVVFGISWLITIFRKKMNKAT